MTFPRAFFAFQLTVVHRLVARFSLSLGDALQQYTTFAGNIALEHWEQYLAGIQATNDGTEWAYQWDLVQRAPGPQPGDTTLYGRELFGCFHYSVHKDRNGDATIVRPHFIKNDQAGMRALGAERLAVRRAEVRRMFVHVQEHVPNAKNVRGHSWLYNLPAYRRVYPPAYTMTMPTVSHDEFQYLSLWGQCFDRNWQPKQTVTKELLRRLETLDDLGGLRFCFPYQVRLPRCKIDEIYTYLEIGQEHRNNYKTHGAV